MTKIDYSIWMDSIKKKEKKKNIYATVPFLQVSNMESSIDFYINRLEFKIVESWEPDKQIKWCHIKKDGGDLMLQEHQSYHSMTSKQGISVYFFCKDALALYQDLKLNKVQPTEPIVSNGMWLTRVNDPDGYEINFESDTDVQEGTTFSTWVD